MNGVNLTIVERYEHGNAHLDVLCKSLIEDLKMTGSSVLTDHACFDAR